MSDKNKGALHIDKNAIGNKIKRNQIYQKQKAEKTKLKKEARVKRQRESEVLGEDVLES